MDDDNDVSRRARPRRALTSVSRVGLVALVARRLRGCQDIGELAQVVAECVVELVRPHQVVVSRVNDDRASVLWSVRPAGPFDEVWTTASWPPLRQILDDRATWRSWQTPSTVPAPLDGPVAASIPMVVNTAVWGLVTVTGEQFDDDDVAFVEIVAALAAAALVRLDFDHQVQHMLVEDPLTGLADRRVADAAADAALDSGTETCIVMCDVDGLKQVNDQLGHGEGDELLRLVGDALRRAAEALPGSTAARIGGDEFCLVVPGWPKDIVVNAMVETIDTYPLPHDAAISWGVASSLGERVTVSSLFRAADFAQYHVKRARARRRQLALPRAADPATTAQQLLSRAIPAVVAGRGELGRVCALAATSADTLGGGEWTVLRNGADSPPMVVARGGSPSGDEEPPATVSVAIDGWQIEVDTSIETSQHPDVTNSLRAAMYIALHPQVSDPSGSSVDRHVGAEGA
ncbi:MAG: GGDEF domain-containing protein [Micrococcales bacterium]|nr:GGDEF domain-containing protein [Micrococcales bacterium]MCL2668265.1 GGDEF domain-containing protein [Micrococcales bacterium]